MGIPFLGFFLASLAGHSGFGIALAFGGVAVIAPWIKGHQQEWMVENHHFGGKSFKFSAEVSDYYRVYVKTAGVALAWLLPTMALMTGMFFAFKSQLALHPKAPPLLVGAVVYACMAPFYLGAWTFIHTQMTNLLYNNAHLGSYRFRSTLGYWEMLGIYFTNGLAVLCTIGLAMPWARIRLARYRADHLDIVGAGELDDFVRDAFAHGEIGAAATEMDSLLGIDIGL
jgi:uncharacterized membrane protein YjgN (DUF898 family)